MLHAAVLKRLIVEIRTCTYACLSDGYLWSQSPVGLALCADQPEGRGDDGHAIPSVPARHVSGEFTKSAVFLRTSHFASKGCPSVTVFCSSNNVRPHFIADLRRRSDHSIQDCEYSRAGDQLIGLLRRLIVRASTVNLHQAL
jgi:hypothetical protein